MLRGITLPKKHHAGKYREDESREDPERLQYTTHLEKERNKDEEQKNPLLKNTHVETEGTTHSASGGDMINIRRTL